MKIYTYASIYRILYCVIVVHTFLIIAIYYNDFNNFFSMELVKTLKYVNICMEFIFMKKMRQLDCWKLSKEIDNGFDEN